MQRNDIRLLFMFAAQGLASWIFCCKGQDKKMGAARAPKGGFSFRKNSVVVSRFAVRGDVQSFALFLFRHSQADEHVDHFVSYQ